MLGISAILHAVRSAAGIPSAPAQSDRTDDVMSDEFERRCIEREMRRRGAHWSI